MLNRERIAGQHVAHTTQAMEENVVETHAAQPSRWSRVALVIGGLLFVAMYVQQQIFAAQTGRLPQISELSTSITAWTNGALFSLAIILIAVGLVGIGAWMRQRAPKLSIAAMIFATLAFVGHAVNFVLLLSVTGAPTYIGLLAGLGVVSSLLSTTLLGIAALRTRAFSRAINWTLVSVGLVTFPVILLTIPLEAVLPPYVISDLPFPVWGAIFAGIGYALLRTERNVLVLAAGAITSAVVQRTDPIIVVLHRRHFQCAGRQHGCGAAAHQSGRLDLVV